MTCFARFYCRFPALVSTFTVQRTSARFKEPLFKIRKKIAQNHCGIFLNKLILGLTSARPHNGIQQADSAHNILEAKYRIKFSHSIMVFGTVLLI